MSSASRGSEMEKLDPKIDGATPDIVQQNVEQLKKLFPEIVTEDKIDFDALQEAAGKIAAHHLHKREGVLIGDVVGLGKK